MGKKILIIEDEADMAQVVDTRMKKSGYEINVVESGEEAFEFLKNSTPDLILLDLLLPQMQGQEVCKKLKNDHKLRQIPVILFTASASDIPKIAKEIGADDYILKPYNPGELLSKVRKLTGSGE